MFTVTFLLLALLAAAAPPEPLLQVTDPMVTVPVSRRIHSSTATIPEIDRARAAQYLAKGHSPTSTGQSVRRQKSLNVINQVVTYTAEVGVGNPATKYSLIIDTGSSNTWVGAGKSYVRTKTSHATGNIADVNYGSGMFVGPEYKDTVSLTDELVITAQSIDDAVLSEGFNGVDGILGIGPTDLTEGTMFPNFSAVPTITDNLFSQGTISQKVIGIYFAPTISESATNGEMIFGGIDNSKITGDVTFVPITNSSPANEFFGIDQSVTYGKDRTTILSSAAGIVDTGTTLTLLATEAFDTYKNLTGATEDQSTGLLTISPENYAELQSLYFNIGGKIFEFTKNAQTWPRILNEDIGGTSDEIYLVIGDLGTLGGGGLDFINGMTFLERFYSVFDSSNDRVGLATTPHTFDETN